MFLLIVFILLVGGAVRGHKVGFVREVSGALRLILAVIMLVCIVRAIGGYLDHNSTQTLTSVAVLTIVGVFSKFSGFVISALHIIGKLPLIKDLNKFLGAVLGVGEGLFLAYALQIVLPIINVSVPDLLPNILNIP